MNYDYIAIHEAAHAVFLYMVGIRPKKATLYNYPLDNKLGKVISAKRNKYDILLYDETKYYESKRKQQIIKETRARLLAFIAGNCAERFFLKEYPDYPPDMTVGADGHNCYLLIEKLCYLHYKSFNNIMFNQLYFRLMNHVYEKIKSDEHLYDIIKIVANKLYKNRKRSLRFGTISRIIFYNLIKKIVFFKYRPHPFLELDLINELDNRNSVK